MPDMKLEDLPSASTLSLADLFYVVQGNIGKGAAGEQIAALMRANLYPATGAMARTVVEHAFRRRFLGPDGSEQVRISDVPGAVEFIDLRGAIAGKAPAVMAWSESLANVTGILVAKGTGGWRISNGAGPIAVFEEGGVNKQVDAPLRFRGGATDWSTQPGLYADANRKIWMGVAGKRVLEVRADSAGAGDTVALGVAVDATTAKITAEGSNTTVGLYLQAKGAAGQLTFGNTLGNLALLTSPTGGAAPSNYLNIRAGSTGQTVQLGVVGEAVPLQLGYGGYADLSHAMQMSGFKLLYTGDGNSFTWTMANTSSGVHLHGGGSTIAAATLTTPAAPKDGQIIEVTTSDPVTSLTVSANSGQTISGEPSAAAMAVTDSFRWKYIASITKWVRA